METDLYSLLYLMIGLIIGNFLPSFMKKKGENLATKQDIRRITELTEEVKGEQNKLLTNFELYTVKKHECYPELFKLIEICNGAVQGLRGFQRGKLDFESLNAQEIESEMHDKQIIAKDRELIRGLWNNTNDKKQAKIYLDKISQRINYNKAEEKIIEANNYFYFKILYLSKDIEKSGSDLLQKIWQLWLSYDPDHLEDKIRAGGDVISSAELIEDIDSMKTDLKLIIRKELFPSEYES
ncbi:hypothetical protein HNR44_001427 [Geomicrobium halophilum]|uniref:Uncharacterized protein n=1 Tax=Geomicrobium halophilum TaxID=549000 RepID=A0A841Q167_9BACL|nr:hypothetical protein [Geomicrobium halophilum]MBB6449478.1 hypothetical protein [Geomicrobium halophilum]